MVQVVIKIDAYQAKVVSNVLASFLSMMRSLNLSTTTYVYVVRLLKEKIDEELLKL